GRRSGEGATNHTITAITTRAAAYIAGIRRQPPTSAIKAGAISLVIDAPTLPAPNTPRAKPWRSRSDQAAFQAMPTEKEFPPSPRKKAQASSPLKVVAREAR